MSLFAIARRFTGSMVWALLGAAPLALASPYASIDFSPTAAREGELVRLAIGVADNATAPLSNIALASGAFTYPVGMTNSAMAPSNGCGGTLVASSGSNTLSLSGGAAPSGFCAIYVWVVTTGPGTYNATIPQGAVTTGQGPTIVPWSATLVVTPSQVVTTTADSGPGSLRAAIDFVNLSCTGPYAITFNIPGTGPHVILVGSSLPPVTCGGTIIDGYSQSGALPNANAPGSNSATIKIELSAACSACQGLSLQANGIRVSGLAIHSFDLGNIVSSVSAEIHGNFIGTDASGNASLSNLGPGVHVAGGSALIGIAGEPSTANLISNNVKGIFVEGSATIADNTIGGRANGLAGNGNSFGIYVATGGGTTRIEGNAIRHNASSGIAVASDVFARVIINRNASALNGGAGIDLNNDGPSPNDEDVPFDADSGANGTQNFPTITQVTHSGGDTIVSGHLRTSGSFPYAEFFSNSAIRAGITEGETYVGGGVLSLGAGQAFSFTLTGIHDNISATATVDTCGDGCTYTSEYSPSVAATLLGPVVTLDQSTLAFSAVAGSMSASQTVTLTNSGNQPLTFSATQFTFPPEFVLTHTCPLPPATLAVAATCQVTLIFNAPATPGTTTGLLKVNSDALNSASASLSGVSTPVQSLAVTPASHDFGNQEVGTPSAPQAFTVSNIGSSPVEIFPVSTTGDFSAQSSCPATLAKGATCTIAVKFVPTAVGARSGTLVINASDGSYVQSLAGNGTAPIAPAIGVTPTSLGFGSRTLGTASPAQTVTVVNSGTAPLLILGIAVSGDFAFTSTCPASLVAGASCSIGVKFTPLVSGNRSGNLTISTNAPGSPTLVALSGVGVDVPVGTLAISPLSLDFGAHPVNVASPVQWVDVSNVGSATVFIVDIGLTGDFAFGDAPSGATACGGPLAPGASCAVAVLFQASAAGTRLGVLHIGSDGTNFSADVDLAGFGVATAPQLALSLPGSLTFAPQPFGTTSAGQIVRLTNASGAPVVVGDIDTSGDFLVSESCTAIPAGGACNATVFFRPTARGARTGTLTVRIQSEATPYVIALLGEGVANPVPILSITPARIGFGNTFVGSVSDAATVVLRNVGEAPLLFDSFVAPGDFTFENHCGTVLAAGAGCSLDVRFFPRMLDARGGALEIRSNAADSPHFVDLSGTGCSIPNVGRSRIPQLLCGP